MRTVILDAASLGSDMKLDALECSAGEFIRYDNTAPDAVAERISNAEICVVNKVVLAEAHFCQAPDLKLIAVTATGTNNIDLQAARKHGIKVVNVIRYGRASVVQHVYSLILALSNHLLDYVASVKNGDWQRSNTFCLMDHPIRELEGKTLGVIGYGDLGQGVAQMGQAFGMHVMVSESATGSSASDDGEKRVPLKQLLQTADVISVHCLLSETTRDLIAADELALMKPTSIIVNAARGGIINEPALVQALKKGAIAGAATDVLTQEPPVDGNPLLAADIPNLIVTPHCAWASREARQRLLDMTAENVRQFIAGNLNRFVI